MEGDPGMRRDDEGAGMTNVVIPAPHPSFPRSPVIPAFTRHSRASGNRQNQPPGFFNECR
jgi:hypothetical protein